MDNTVVCPVSVWRDSDYLLCPKFAEWVFWQILLPQHGSILSDKLQSTDGQRFWFNRLKEAFERKYKISILDMADSQVYNVIPISRLSHVLEYFRTEPDDSAGRYRILITQFNSND